jgi:hypothetical protein
MKYALGEAIVTMETTQNGRKIRIELIFSLRIKIPSCQVSSQLRDLGVLTSMCY